MPWNLTWCTMSTAHIQRIKVIISVVVLLLSLVSLVEVSPYDLRFICRKWSKGMFRHAQWRNEQFHWNFGELDETHCFCFHAKILIYWTNNFVFECKTIFTTDKSIRKANSVFLSAWINKNVNKNPFFNVH